MLLGFTRNIIYVIYIVIDGYYKHKFGIAGSGPFSALLVDLGRYIGRASSAFVPIKIEWHRSMIGDSLS